MNEPLVNKVASSALITLDLEDYFPSEKILPFDLKPFLFQGLILKEKDFRQALQSLDWSVYSDAVVAVHCSADAVIPMWAYMLVASYLQPLAREVVLGQETHALQHLFLKNIGALDLEPLRGKKIVIKGCGHRAIEPYAYLQITNRLRPIAASIMYGEACSTVPVFKSKESKES